MRAGVTLAAAIIAAITLLTTWSISLLPRARDLVVATHTPAASSSILRR